MREIGMKIIEALLMSGVSAVVVIEYFKTFFEKKGIKKTGCFIWVLCFFWKIIEDYVMTDFPLWSRMILSISFVAIAGGFFIGSCLGKIVFSILHLR